MPRTDEELTEVLQVRVSRTAMEAIRQAAKQRALSLAAYARQVLYRDAGLID